VLSWTALSARILAVRRERSPRLRSSSFASVGARAVAPHLVAECSPSLRTCAALRGRRCSSDDDARWRSEGLGDRADDAAVRSAYAVRIGRRSALRSVAAPLVAIVACEQSLHLLARSCRRGVRHGQSWPA
jgi:hypothetical protein